MTCVQHGHFFGSDLLDATFGAGGASRLQQVAARSPTVGRRCPQDRLAMAAVQNASGTVRGEACTRCGSLWIPLDVVDRLLATTPVNAPNESEARSLLAMAAARSVLGVVPARR